MRLAWLAGLAVISGCAHAALEDETCCTDGAEHAAAAPAPVADGDEGRDFAARVEGPARCELAARARLAGAADQAWRQLWGCVNQGHFTALRGVLSGAWDRDLQTRPDAPLLVARVIAERGGDVDNDLRMVHERRVPLFGLAQAMARPQLFRGALIIVRARISPHGLVDETRLVSNVSDVQLGPADQLVTRAAPPWSSSTRRVVTMQRAYNLDVATGRRALAVVDEDPFIDEGDAVVVLARFDGLRDSDGWPVVSLLQHFRPSATVAY